MISEGNTSMYMPVAPAYSNGGFGGGFGNDWGWIILLLLFAGGGMWGNGYGGFGNDGIYPWMNQANLTSNGFQNQFLNDNLTSIRDGIAGISTQLCNSFANVEQGANARQIADMQQMFGIQSSLQNCCCENRANIADLKYTVATENCADRQVVSDGIRDLLANQTASTQRILDQLCQDKLDAKNDTINQLRSELLYARGQASQDVQTAQLIADNQRQTAALEQYLNPAPIPAYVVQNPNCCTNYTCACGA